MFGKATFTKKVVQDRATLASEGIYVEEKPKVKHPTFEEILAGLKLKKQNEKEPQRQDVRQAD